MVGLTLTLIIGGCGRPSPSRVATRPANSTVETSAEDPSPPAFSPSKQSDRPGVHNLVQVSASIYSGSEPHGDEAFTSLAALGVKTVVSVDGARPQVEAAARHGLHYVHIPIGYDGVPRQAGLALARVAREAEGPIYIHCHHGQHRGPAAAAVACMAADRRSGQQALKILEVAGTGKQYAGLWRDVEGYAPPKPGDKLPDLTEVSEVGSFAAAMAKIDRNFDNLKLCQEAQWSVPPEHPDIVPAQESLILKEGLREAVRNLTADRNTEFKTWLAESEALATSLEETIRHQDPAAATAAFKRLEASCKQCHGKYRN